MERDVVHAFYDVTSFNNSVLAAHFILCNDCT